MVLLVLVSYLARPDALWAWFDSHVLLTVLLCLVAA